MNDQKIENLLNISMDATNEERAKSINLETGYNPATRMWEIIVMYNNTRENFEEVLSKYENTSAIYLLGNFAIINTPQANIDLLALEPSVEYIEKPKRLYFELAASKAASCVTPVQAYNSPNLRGNGVIIGVADTGIDYQSPAFRNPDGTTRILYIWDQTADAGGASIQESGNAAPLGYGFGTEYSSEDINRSLLSSSPFSVTDLSGHGTAVTRIAAGSDGVAPECSIIFVKMGLAREESFPRTTQLMCAVDYIVRKSIQLSMPVSINISFGNNYGDHMGGSLLELYLNSVSFAWKTCICIGTGNEADAATHASGKLSDSMHIVDFAVSPYERSINIQIWKQYWDDVRISIVSPSGVSLNTSGGADNLLRLGADGTTILIYNGRPSPFSIMQEIYFDFIPDDEYIAPGIWQLRLTPAKIVYGEYNIWLPSAAAINPSTGFLRPDSYKTLTIPSTAVRAIAVGAYNSYNNSYAAFSGRGYVLTDSGFAISKPDICAPGVNIQVGNRGFTGTSFAAPFAAGCAALLMEWGIVRGNDPFLYGEKLKAYLINGAVELPGNQGTPNPLTGWGTLCMADSLPE